MDQLIPLLNRLFTNPSEREQWYQLAIALTKEKQEELIALFKRQVAELFPEN